MPYIVYLQCLKALRASIPAGGHMLPNSTVGANAEWKYAQKILIKKNTSDTTNITNPKFNPSCTLNVWLPIKVPSPVTSRNHKIITNKVDKKPINNKIPPWLYPWNHITADIAIFINAIDVKIGQGERSTKW